ncbi:hypothetical protein [Virgibacillus halodenitrificans]|uniref:hypothetical protein n=1 Tax=Virgibacillus halodenitrificans TaxID=1482 RepID=UPI00037A62D2|nr:hypothetical protein [Virgibacillus halodenitrificans]
MLVNENELKLRDRTIYFEYTIKSTISLPDRIFILLKIPTRVPLSHKELNNVHCYTISGDKLWQICTSNIRSRKELKSVPYVGLNLDKNNNLFATDFMGRKFQIDVNDGKIIDMQIVK